MLLSPEEFQDVFTLRYQFKAQGNKRNCEGCGGSWGLQHALNCKRAEHFRRRHNEVQNEVNQACCDLAELAFALTVLAAVGREEPVVMAEGEVLGLPALYGDFSVQGRGKQS
uniref:Uncharacterized protein n=1 Tax=Chromera velia CCMP2878 TaxID=1169474 RepID=A0A0G4IEH6_9ALVE|eukprot:Cvel_13609.t1-p1 / transcript=Cvel_13609.t1 / gene=Cvel_13609 / organism=Chromera_velia_CCMP2878 / gene_product=hypothetical protein / transcript_product=hypothetical protein / location=Cvel_scaffold937:23789-24121(+) / protein_length=111 / sequence_SO=supercontig / SO=protein_coding / is_pseudo=false